MAKTVTVEQELAELRRLREAVPALKAAVSSADQRNGVLANDLGAARKRIESLERVAEENAELQKTLANRDREAAALQASLNSVSARTDKAEKTLAAAREMRAILDRVL